MACRCLHSSSASGCQLPWSGDSPTCPLSSLLSYTAPLHSSLLWPSQKSSSPTNVLPSFDFFLVSGSAVLQKDLAMLEAQFLAEEELRHRTLSAQKVQTDWLWLKEASKKHSRAVSGWQLG